MALAISIVGTSRGTSRGLVELWKVLWGEINGALGSLPANFGIFQCGRGEKKWQSV